VDKEFDICIIGGFGHVGLPLAVAFANKGKKVCAFDVSERSYNIIKQGKMPFLEQDGDKQLKKATESGNLVVSLDPNTISKSEILIVTTGTPINIHHSAEFSYIIDILKSYTGYIHDGQLLVLRSTVYPGTTEYVFDMLTKRNKKVDIAFCPERIAQGYALSELYELPQLVSSLSESGLKRATELFKVLTPDIVVLEPREAELGKIFTNVWRYMEFAIGNQLYIAANDAGIDYSKVHKAITYKYKRASDLPMPGFTAGPCLFKDTVQLSTFNNKLLQMGNSAININESMPFYIVNKLKKRYDLKNKNVGILGMAFKADIDDPRDSLSYILRNILDFESKEVYCTDVYIKEEGFLTPEELVKKSDIIIVAAPHKEYKSIDFGGKVVIDIWNFYGKGNVI
jgi:UDP-N-acetyl-D-mannosaminuronic acid dehydrogenase